MCGSLRRYHDLQSAGDGDGAGAGHVAGGGLGAQQLAAFYLTQDMMAHAAFLALAAQCLSLLDRCAALPQPCSNLISSLSLCVCAVSRRGQQLLQLDWDWDWDWTPPTVRLTAPGPRHHPAFYCALLLAAVHHIHTYIHMLL